MSFRLIKAVSTVENIDDFHLVRLLLLLQGMDCKKNKTIEGITKLAKFDFLLRYPNCLERALQFLSKHQIDANINPHERTTIETKMIRYRYGPWDERYRRWIGLLVARGLVLTFVRGRTVHIGLTDLGRKVSTMFSTKEEFEDLKLRSNIIINTFGKYSASKIKNFIYEIFPEISTLKWGEKITL